jgi:hypothetical protein
MALISKLLVASRCSAHDDKSSVQRRGIGREEASQCRAGRITRQTNELPRRVTPYWLAVTTSIGLSRTLFSGQAVLAMLAVPEEADLRIDLDRCVEI